MVRSVKEAIRSTAPTREAGVGPPERDERGHRAPRNGDHGRPSAAQVPLWATLGGAQAQLTVGVVDDPLEREADQVAEKVTGVAAGPAVTPPPTEASEPDGGSGEDVAGGVQRSAGDNAAGRTPGWQALVRSSLAGGRPLADEVRSPLEARLRTDLDGVRVHDDGPADAAARAVGARALTVGDDVVFRAGEYQTATPAGRRLLVHELTHVVQQRSAVGPGNGGGARVRRDPGPPPATPAPGGQASSEPKLTFTVTPDRVMTAAQHLYLELGFVPTNPRVRPDGLVLLSYALDIASESKPKR